MTWPHLHLVWLLRIVTCTQKKDGVSSNKTEVDLGFYKHIYYSWVTTQSYLNQLQGLCPGNQAIESDTSIMRMN